MTDDLTYPKVPKRIYPETTPRKPLTPRLKIALVAAQKKRCALCGCSPRKFEFDHIKPVWDAGTSDPDNFRALCAQCHLKVTKDGTAERAVMNRKRDKTSQWARRQKAKPEMKVNRNGSLTVKS